MVSFTILAKLVCNVIAFVGVKNKRKTQSLSCDKLFKKRKKKLLEISGNRTSCVYF